MRGKNVTQMTLFDHSFQEMLTLLPVDKELKHIDALLEDMPEIVDCIHKDLQPEDQRTDGRPGVHAERVLRAAILKTMKQLPYRELAKAIHGNLHYRWFTKYNLDNVPHFSTLQKLINRINPVAWSLVKEIIVQYTRESRFEKGHSIRADTTVVETDIGYPIDAKLLKDCVRVLTRTMERALIIIPGKKFAFAKRERRAKKRSYQIVMAKGPKVKQIRKKHYKDLIKVTNEVYEKSVRCLKQLEKSSHLEAFAIAEQLDHFMTLASVVIDQSERRVLHDEKVPVDQKVVSIFEEHTDIIKRGKTQCPTEFGHKVLFVTGKIGIITQYKTYQGNPGDNTMVEDIISVHKKQFSKAPRSFAGDRRFFSADNDKIAQKAGVQKMSVCKPGKRSKARIDFEKNGWFKKLQKFRAGIEGTISALMRGCGMKRCLWKGWRSFQSYVGLCVVTFNLRKLAAV